MNPNPSSRRSPIAHPLARHPIAWALVVAFAASSAHAADFTISGADATARTLGSASGQTGTVTSTGALTVGSAAVAVTITGNDATLNNLGSIVQTGTGRVIRDNTGVTNLVVNNGSVGNAGATLQAADGDVIQINRPAASVTFNNYGQVISSNASAGGSQAIDFSAITSGTNVVNNFAGGLLRAVEADAVRPGVGGIVYNAGRIVSVTTTGSSSDGVDLQSNGGVSITNDTGGLVEGGRHGITGGAADATVNYAATIVNRAGARIQGDNGSGLNFDGFNARQTVTVTNAGTIVGNGLTGDGDGVDVDGLAIITNSGVIRSANAFSAPASGRAFSEGITIGGGSVVNTGTIEGLVAAGNTNAVGRGITFAGNDITSGALAGTREAIYGNATVTNSAGGTIRGQGDSAIAVDGAASGFKVAIVNAAGATLSGGSATAAVVRTGLDNDTLTNGGTIDGSAGGKAIDLGGGDNTLNIVGGSAFIVGDVSGGNAGGVGGTNLLAIDLGSGHRFAYAGSLSNFARVDARSGITTLSGASSYRGTTTVETGATLVLDGRGRLSGASALDLAGGTLRLANAGRGDGQTFASLAVGANSAIDLGGSSLTFDALGNVVDDAMLTITDFLATTSTDYAIRFAGDLTNSAMFRELLSNTTIDGHAATFRFDGTYTSLAAAVPEPGTVALLVAGIGVAARRGRRAARSRS